MPTINQLPLRSPVSPGDQIPIYSPNNGDARRTPVSAVVDLVVNGLDLPNTAVLLTGDQTVGGTKTFSNAIVGSITGNAGTVTNGVYTTGNQTVGGTKTFSSAIVGDITGNAGSVTNGVYTTGNQTISGTKTFSNAIVGDITGNAGSVTNGVYTTGNQTIGGTKTFSSAIVGDITGNAGTATTATTATTAGSVTNGVYTVGDQTIGGTKTFSVNPILSAGTVNAILTLDGSKQISAVSGLTWDSTKSNLSLGGVTVGQGNVPSLNNIAFGPSVLNAITTGYRNLGIGNDTLKVVTTGYSNVSIGSQSGQSLTTGFNNVFIGSSAGLSATTPGRNIAIGSDAGIGLTTGQSNVLMGATAGYTLVAGDGNTFVGDGAGYSHRGSNNVYVGGGAGGSLNGTGAWNTSIGYNAGGGGGTSTYNTCIGHEAGKSLVNAGANTLVGVKAGDQIQSGQANTVIGRFSGNQSSLDIRLTDNNIVLSDGVGNPRCYYDGPNNAWIWRTGASERMRITSGGSLGIGAEPTSGIELFNASGQTTAAITTGTNVGSFITLRHNSAAAGAGGGVILGAQGGNFAAIKGLLSNGANNTTGALAFATRNASTDSALTERMLITSSGDVGIGTSSPGAKLDVVGTVNSTQGFTAASASAFQPQTAMSNYAADATGGYYLFYKGRPGATTSQSGDTLGTVAWLGRDTSNTAVVTGSIFSAQTAAAGAGSVPTALVFANGGNQERMRISSGGNVGIGTADPQATLHVAGTILAANSFGNLATLQAVGGTGFRWTLNNDGTYRLQRTTDGFSSVATTPILFDASGNVGIGTTGPNSVLDIYRASATNVYITTGNTTASWLTGVAAGGDYDIYSNNASNIKFSNNGSERMRITSAGNVGIGTTSPAVRLEVAGQIRTEAPTGGTAANWRLGTVHTVSPTSPNRTIEVDIGGTIYYLHAKTTNN